MYYFDCEDTILIKVFVHCYFCISHKSSLANNLIFVIVVLIV